MKGGNLTTSTVVFTATRHDHLAHVSCQAMNPALRDNVLMESRQLNVFCEYTQGNLIKSTLNQIVFTSFRFIWIQTEVRLESRQLNVFCGC